jgi:hypothetical protein
MFSSNMEKNLYDCTVLKCLTMICGSIVFLNKKVSKLVTAE